MPVYKTDIETLKETIQSVLDQTYENFEFLIVDDCPSDTREDLVKSFNDPRIKYSINKTNLGISPTRNKLLSMAKGQFIAILDHDDLCDKTRFKKEIDFLEKNTMYGAVSCNYQLIPAKTDVIQPKDSEEIKTKLFETMPMLHSGMMIRTSILRKYNIEYRESFSPCEDYMLCIELANCTMLYNIQENLMYYRDAPNNTTNTRKQLMIDRDASCKDYLLSHYPYRYGLYKNIMEMNAQAKYQRVVQVKTFMGIKLATLKYQNNHVYVYLFGLIKIMLRRPSLDDRDHNLDYLI